MPACDRFKCPCMEPSGIFFLVLSICGGSRLADSADEVPEGGGCSRRAPCVVSIAVFVFCFGGVCGLEECL